MNTRTPIISAVALSAVLALSIHPATAAPGNLDPTFGTAGKVTTNVSGTSEDSGEDSALQADGKIIVVGSTRTGAVIDWLLARYTADGVLDTTFGTGGKVTTNVVGTTTIDYANAVALQADEKPVVVGTTSTLAWKYIAVARYNTNGTLDTSFSTDGKATVDIGPSDNGTDVAVQPDGKILVLGWADTDPDSIGIDVDFVLIRYESDGSLDTDFGTGGIVTTEVSGESDIAYGIHLLSSGKILAVGKADGDVALVRYLANGTVDSTFGTGGKVITSLTANSDTGQCVVVQSDGKIVVLATTNDQGVALLRYSADGVLDPTFGTGGKALPGAPFPHDYATELIILSDGSILAAGNYNGDFMVSRYSSAGALDTTFGVSGRATTDFGAGVQSGARSIHLQSEGKIVVTGYADFETAGTNEDFALARYDLTDTGSPSTGPDPAVVAATVAIEKKISKLKKKIKKIKKRNKKKAKSLTKKVKRLKRQLRAL